ncbi:DNA adenine methylase [Curtobacterium sp. VKM Ac-2887]|uniref:DNA adenine methylase n=1 Tax=Curtobacterium sp. VKM Ac-2887 TaxID=2783819 RepID=UPI00188DB31A|nr:DNA adenine methylase [Curtobacterium sp. VKM Ac-2887]MBF4587577.1 DNA adenine methylase [Curtobacterium sp. VKM Ac-2887]
MDVRETTLQAAVGAHLAGTHIRRAHRVLQGSGTVAPGLRWPDASDGRDPRADLEAEGRASYAGHYFSPHQASVFDGLYDALPTSPNERDVLLAALLATASDCAAAPGHTAQPFQPTTTALPHIVAAWRIDPLARVRRYIEDLTAVVPRRQGCAAKTTAEEFLNDADLRGAVVFCDPPYSEVQYSRFYHVLEGMAVGGWPSVSGSGRAPELSLRFTSAFSSRRHSTAAFAALFESLRKSGATAILTFPNHLCSNGQSAATLATLAAEQFDVNIQLLDGRHSSLGANASSLGGRVAHRDVAEAVLVLRPRSKR